MNKLHLILDRAGLSDSEKTVYITGRELGTSESSLLVSKTRLPRPTVMTALTGLREIGLCLVTKRDGRSLFYTMQPPQALATHLGAKIRSIESVIDTIQQLPPEAPPVHAEHKTEQTELIKHLELALQCQSRQWRIIAPKDNALRYLPEPFITHFKATRSRRQIGTQTLWEGAYSKQAISLLDTLMRKPRYLPKSTSIDSMIISFDASLLLISGKTNPASVLVHGEDMVMTYNTLFDLAWRSCRETS